MEAKAAWGPLAAVTALGPLAGFIAVRMGALLRTSAMLYALAAILCLAVGVLGLAAWRPASAGRKVASVLLVAEALFVGFLATVSCGLAGIDDHAPCW